MAKKEEKEDILQAIESKLKLLEGQGVVAQRVINELVEEKLTIRVRLVVKALSRLDNLQKELAAAEADGVQMYNKDGVPGEMQYDKRQLEKIQTIKDRVAAVKEGYEAAMNGMNSDYDKLQKVLG